MSDLKTSARINTSKRPKKRKPLPFGGVLLYKSSQVKREKLQVMQFR
jgi:hypothetical protein